MRRFAILKNRDKRRKIFEVEDIMVLDYIYEVQVSLFSDVTEI